MRRALIVLLGSSLTVPAAFNAIALQSVPLPGQPVVWSINLGSLVLALTIIGALIKATNTATKFHTEVLMVLGQHRVLWQDYQRRQPEGAKVMTAGMGGD